MNKEAQNAYFKMSIGNREIPNRNRELAETMTSVLLDRAYFNDEACCMEVLVNTYVKKTVAAKCGLASASSVNTVVNVLVNAGILSCIESGVYRFDPAVFGSRDWHTVTEASVVHRFGKGYEKIAKLNYGAEEVILETAQVDKNKEPEVSGIAAAESEPDAPGTEYMPTPEE